MAELKEVLVPDIGGDEVQVIELCAAVGDSLAADDSILTVESDKATMDIPAPFAGTLAELKVAVGDTISEGTLIAMMSGEASAEATPAAEEKAEKAAKAAKAAPVQAESVAPVVDEAPSVMDITVPDIGGDEDVPVIEVLVAVGDTIEAEAGLVTLETDKATMDVPSSHAGVVKSVELSVGDTVSQGTLVITLEVAGETQAAALAQAPKAAEVEAPKAAPAKPASASKPPVPYHPSAGTPVSTGVVHASPSVRRLAREFGVDLTQVKGTSRKGRIVKEDVQAYVKYELSRPKATAASSVAGGAGGLQVIAAPKVDFAKFGEVEEVPLSRIQKISGPNLHRNWVTIPHVTQFDEADITEMEAFRKQQNELLAKQKQNLKITPLVFMIKAVAKALQQFPVFNSSLSADGESLVMKKYYHVGVAVDTPNGLVVPVVRDVDQKGIHELSRELMEISVKAREGKLKSADMQGSCFTISSLGGIGGTAFTPIVNYPDVAILGVSKSEIKPKWNGKDFEPKLMLPLSLSYDHRVIDGAMAARFSVTLSGILSDIRTMIL
ncbi:dihydrolipoyllysine-residue acetyltransferase [Parashewanella spongiae]|uniref:Acetyltransferase component of pyruvate dehydrogenase complex n=1 Tax=Parashewanella spongiae TaxID=342950 RepID=A0A3A6UA66_9GAMM|nr:dihydrolipoyllysine-residue acetyltransferase [Parashewanella spongiae]MCL1077445.1 dihydrolipoyllysine-residue acetyltransferase [Parashewanella spongiae]RJY18414.1 dihydrolipoyllysine-residue acetyltransferase [Parashewanella spongiae]